MDSDNSKDFAPGLPDKSKRVPLPKFEKSKIWEFVVQSHEALRRGHHYDLRLADPSTEEAHSWAMPPRWPQPGQTVKVIAQPTHRLEYLDWEGTIPKGIYGAGKVTTEQREKTEITHSQPDHVSFNLYKGKGPEEYALHRLNDKVWSLTNKTPTKEKFPELPTHKPLYRSVTYDKIPVDNPNQVISAKIDDAHNLFVLGDTHKPVRIFSYRHTDRPTGLIEHTHKVPGFEDLKVPASLKDTVIRGGLYALDPKTNKAISNAALGGLLNSNVWASREEQKTKGRLEPVIYDLVKFKGQPFENKSYGEKLEALKEIQQLIPILKLPRIATTKEEKLTLINDIKENKLPETQEGVVIQSLNKATPPIKAKLKQEHDVYIKDFFAPEASSKYEGNAVGGFTYSHTENGPTAGRAASGLTNAQRRDMFKNPGLYKGLVVKVEAMEKYPSGALRAPVFKGFHLDKNDQIRLDQVKL